MLIVFSGPINREPYFAAAWNLIGQHLQAQPLGKLLRLEPRIMKEPRELFDGGFLIALLANQLGLAARLFVDDRPYKLGDGFNLMPVCCWHHLFDKIFHACR